MRAALSALFAAALIWSAPALAQDDEASDETATEAPAEEETDLLGADDEEDVDVEETAEERAKREAAEAAARIKEADDARGEDEGIEDLDDATDEVDGTDLLDEDIAPDQIGGEGQDNARIYRDFAEEVGDYVIDEELVAWEEYLRKYNNTLFRDRIEKRMDELEARMYEERLDLDEPERVDADKREIRFAEGLMLASINPRTRFQTGFEWGLPNYMNLALGYEHQILRTLSAHASLGRRFTGWSFDLGAHYALIKSARTKTIVTLLADVRANMAPFFVAARPQIGIGRKFGDLDVQAQVGVELDSRSGAPAKALGGINLSYQASDNVGAFLETSTYMKTMTWVDGGSFRFNLASFGLKFYPNVGDLEQGDLEVNVGASVPYTANYWMFHFGSIMARLNWYM